VVSPSGIGETNKSEPMTKNNLSDAAGRVEVKQTYRTYLERNGYLVSSALKSRFPRDRSE
jgi:hypothetical protein